MKTTTSLYILLKRENSRYFLLQRDPAGAHYLEYFLTSDVRIRVESFIKEFEDDQEYGAAMNATQYTKDKNGVLISPEWLIDEEENVALGHYILINSLVLAELLRQWKTVYLQQPPYIFIKIENNIPTVTGFNECPIV